MTAARTGFTRQIAQHSVALISLTVAILSLGYNTWRNEQTESNRNVRVAAFEALTTLGDLQTVIFHAHYDRDQSGQGNPRTGWAHVLKLQDLAALLNPDVQDAVSALAKAWDTHWAALGQKGADISPLLKALDEARSRTVALLTSLQ